MDEADLHRFALLYDLYRKPSKVSGFFVERKAEADEPVLSTLEEPTAQQKALGLTRATKVTSDFCGIARFDPAPAKSVAEWNDILQELHPGDPLFGEGGTGLLDVFDSVALAYDQTQFDWRLISPFDTATRRVRSVPLRSSIQNMHNKLNVLLAWSHDPIYIEFIYVRHDTGYIQEAEIYVYVDSKGCYSFDKALAWLTARLSSWSILSSFKGLGELVDKDAGVTVFLPQKVQRQRFVLV